MTKRIVDADAMREFGRNLGRQLRAGDVVVLSGPLGAGKTTLTQGLAEGLDVKGSVTSPTFVVVRVHKAKSASAPALVHVDAYRLSSSTELAELDLDQFGSAVLVIEWGAPIIADYADEWLDISIDRSSAPQDDDPASGIRVLTLTAHGPRWAGISA